MPQEACRIEPDDLLIIVDVQNDFCPGGALPVPHGDRVIGPANLLAYQFPHVVITQDWHPHGHASFASTHPGHCPFDVVQVGYGEQTLWPDHCVQGTWGAELHPGLDAPKAELILRKGRDPQIDSYSAFFENDRRTTTGLGAYLRDRGYKRLFLAGLAVDFCVRYTALDARLLDFDTVVIEDACRPIDTQGSLEVARKEMDQSGVQRILMSQIGISTQE